MRRHLPTLIATAATALLIPASALGDETPAPTVPASPPAPVDHAPFEGTRWYLREYQAEDGGTAGASDGAWLTFADRQVTGSTGAASYTLLTAASITGTPTLSSPISGYILQIVGGNQLRLVQSGSPYDTWSGGAPFGGDSNNDGVDNGLAFLLGASGPNVSALNKLPTVTQSAGGLTLSFSMLHDTANGNATLAIEYGNSLVEGSWTAVQVPYSSGIVDDIVFNVTGTGPLNVTATIPVSKAGGTGKLFGRVKGVNP